MISKGEVGLQSKKRVLTYGKSAVAKSSGVVKSPDRRSLGATGDPKEPEHSEDNPEPPRLGRVDRSEMQPKVVRRVAKETIQPKRPEHSPYSDFEDDPEPPRISRVDEGAKPLKKTLRRIPPESNQISPNVAHERYQTVQSTPRGGRTVPPVPRDASRNIQCNARDEDKTGQNARTAGSTKMLQRTTQARPDATQRRLAQKQARPERNYPDNEVVAKPKKRRTGRLEFERREQSASLYSTPDASPKLSVSREPCDNVPERISPQGAYPVKSPPRSQMSPVADEDVILDDVAEELQDLLPVSVQTTKTMSMQISRARPPAKQRPDLSLPLSHEMLWARPRDARKKRESPAPSRRKLAGRSVSSTILDSPPSPVPAAISVPTRKRRKRLIDALISQAPEEDGGEYGEDILYSWPPQRLLLEKPLLVQRDTSGASEVSALPSQSSTYQSQASSIVRQAPTAKKAGPKFTYGQQQTMRAEENVLEAARLVGTDKPPKSAPKFNFRALLQPPPTLDQFEWLDDDEDVALNGAVRSIHELRQAGANSRFEDDMSDIFSRIGSPTSKLSTTRRGALLELADRIGEKEFRRQFRDFGDQDDLYKYLGTETDLIAGYTIMAIATTLLGTSISSHLVHQLEAQDMPAFLTRLISETTDIAQLARNKKRGVGRIGQATLNNIKFCVLKLPIWEPAKPSTLSPRTLALKCLDLILRQSRGSVNTDRVFTTNITDQLFAIVSAGADQPEHWDFPSREASNDFYMALALVETISLGAMESQLRGHWASNYVPIVSDVLASAMNRPADKVHEIDVLALRLSINATNNSMVIARDFVESGMLRKLVAAACPAFERLVSSIEDGHAFASATFESLVLTMGIIINFCEHFPLAAQRLAAADGDAKSTSLGQLIRVFLDNHSKTSDADSLEKVNLNVALGYLSIVLGYLCMHQPIKEKFFYLHARRSLEPLIVSMREFVKYRKLAESQYANEGGELETSTTERLEKLIEELEELC